MTPITEEQQQLVQSVRRLMDDHVPEPLARELDDEGRYPYELYKQWAEAGLLSLAFDDELGGGGGTVFDMVLVTEEIGRKGYDFVAAYGTPVFNGLNVAEHGTAEQKKEFLPSLFAGDVRLAVSITEPDAGSDAASIRTRATRDGDGFLLNGEKLYTSGADIEDTVLLIYCRTGEQGDRNGISCFLVDNTTPGLQIERVETLGRRMFGTTRLMLDDVWVPGDRVLGELGGGWKVLLSGLQFERIVTSAAYVGNAQAVVDEALAYARGRRQFGQPIGDFQVISHMLADMKTEVAAARLLTYSAAQKLDQGLDALEDVCMAKLFGSETFKRVAIQGVQILGGYGYSMESAMQRHLRAAVGGTITAGTSQMQRQTIARRMGLKPR